MAKRLKKGSAAAKAWGAKMRRLRNKSKSSTKLKRRTRKMAKRYKKRRSYKKSASVMGINTAKALAAVIYGAIRAKTSTILEPYTSKIPLGNISDEVGMLVVTTLGKKFLFKKAGTLREAMTAGQTIELARIGDAVISGQVGNILGGIMGGAAPNSNGNIF
jgi:hypothetical protein